MRRFVMLLLGAVAFAGFSAGVEAADYPVKARPIITKAPPPPVSSGSSGFYIGVNGGYGWGRPRLTEEFGFSDTIDASGGLIGGTFGYNAQSGAFVYGLETDLAASWSKGTSSPIVCFGCEVKLTYFGTLRGRLGYAVGQALPYVTAGFAYGGVKTSFAGFGSDTDLKGGWTVGAGLEYAVSGPWSVKAEYLYFELARAACDITACGLPAVDVKFKGSVARGGVNYRF